MMAVIQRVSRARVVVGGETAGEIGTGLLVLLGVHRRDRTDDACWLAQKTAGLRLFRDDEGNINRSVIEVGGAALVVSQFTLYGDCRKGRRPSFVEAAPGDQAEPLYRRYVAALAEEGVPVRTGVFGAMMQVDLVNDGPVTVIVSTDHLPPPGGLGGKPEGEQPGA